MTPHCSSLPKEVDQSLHSSNIAFPIAITVLPRPLAALRSVGDMYQEAIVTCRILISYSAICTLQPSPCGASAWAPNPHPIATLHQPIASWTEADGPFA